MLLILNVWLHEEKTIAIGRNEWRGKTGIDMVGSFLSYSNVERITTGEKDG